MKPIVQISTLSTKFITYIYKLFNIPIQANFNYRRATSHSTKAPH